MLVDKGAQPGGIPLRGHAQTNKQTTETNRQTDQKIAERPRVPFVPSGARTCEESDRKYWHTQVAQVRVRLFAQQLSVAPIGKKHVGERPGLRTLGEPSSLLSAVPSANKAGRPTKSPSGPRDGAFDRAAHRGGTSETSEWSSCRTPKLLPWVLGLPRDQGV